MNAVQAITMPLPFRRGPRSGSYALATSAAAAAAQAIRRDDAPGAAAALEGLRSTVAREAVVAAAHDAVVSAVLDIGADRLEVLRAAVASGALTYTTRGTFLRALEMQGETETDGRAFAEWMQAYVETLPGQVPPDMPGRFRECEFKQGIDVGSSNLPEQMQQIGEVLADPRLALYQRGGQLVELTRWHDGHRATPVTELRLVELISRVAWFQRWDARTKRAVRTPCPPDLARTYLARAGVEWHLPRLDAVIHAPTLRADGSILDAPGYDRQTGLFLDALGEPIPNIPDDPDEAEQDAALATLADLIAEFPFVSPVDRSVALAAMLTGCIRRSLPTAPMFCFTAPTPGTGKSLLVSVITMIATGRTVKGTTWGVDHAENAKRLDAALLEGKPVIAFDNVSAPLGGDRLNQMLTESHASIRPLGQSKIVEVACAAFVIANGNNLAIKADLTRRALVCRLDAEMEKPEDRQFHSDPWAAVTADRGRYLAAALTLLRAFECENRMPKPRQLGSFNDWSDWVRGTLIWMGLPDPVDSMEHGRAADPHRDALAAVLGQWDEVIGDRQVSTAQIIAAATTHVEFREALLGIAGVGGAVNTGRFGQWLRNHKDRVIGGLRIEPGPTIHGTRTWVLRGASPGPRLVVSNPANDLQGLM